MVMITVLPSGPRWKDLLATPTVTGISLLEPWTYSCKGRRKVVRVKGKKVESEKDEWREGLYSAFVLGALGMGTVSFLQLVLATRLGPQ